MSSSSISYSQLIKEKKHLSFQEAYQMQRGILDGSIDTKELVSIFLAMEGRYPSVEEMNGIIAATRESMLSVPIKVDALDIVGTGGDGLRTFNISTIASVVCAACDVPVVKHGSRSASSRCGSADVLEALGVNIMLEPSQAIKCFDDIGMVFLFAQRFHPALKNAAEARKQYGKRTYFNILGPLVNPAGVSHQTLGVFDEEIKVLMGEASVKTGIKRLWAVRSNDGMDEVSLFSLPSIIEFSGQYPKGNKVDISYPLHKGRIEEIQINEVDESVKIILDILNNRATAVQTQTVVINAAIGLMTFGKNSDLQQAKEIASEAIRSGKALKKLNQLIEVSKHV
ncbi:MAG TPA: anthranilate phosphoribosyltransferase [Bacteroidia bacterium]|jgi:anthranilate phosphoribosyltransferase|nr:anthranilate phosphoribosyltransferase [Bacteroidia bacterium]